MRRRMTSRYGLTSRDRPLIALIQSARRASALVPHPDFSYPPTKHNNKHLLRVSMARGWNASSSFHPGGRR